MANRDHAFKRRMNERQANQDGAAERSPTDSSAVSFLGGLSNIANIALAVVAIFGYFYTVRPIYQKERLEEEVAKLQTSIEQQEPQVAELKKQISALSSERAQLDAQNTASRSELARSQIQLSATVKEYEKALDQMQFMSFSYRLPNGKPATTEQEVRLAQLGELRRAFFADADRCTYVLSDPRYHGLRLKDAMFPFAKEEVDAWRLEGANMPAQRAQRCIERRTSEFIKSRTESVPTLVGSVQPLRVQLLARIKEAIDAKAWTPPFEPQSLIDEVAEKRSQIAVTQAVETEAAEQKYKDRDKGWNAYKKAILQNNYEIELQNAKNRAINAEYKLESVYIAKAGELRTSVEREMNRLYRAAGLTVRE